jgi:predicted GNAT family acetyltransferase
VGKVIQAEYIESGTFVAGEEDVYLAGIESGDECVVLKKADYDKLKKQKNQIKSALKILEDLRTTAHYIAKAGPLNTKTLDEAWSKFMALEFSASFAMETLRPATKDDTYQVVDNEEYFKLNMASVNENAWWGIKEFTEKFRQL